jgi:hypothetical protein
MTEAHRADEFRALTERVAELERRVAYLTAEVFTIRTIEEAIFRAQTGRPAPAAVPRRPRHLRAVSGGQS